MDFGVGVAVYFYIQNMVEGNNIWRCAKTSYQTGYYRMDMSWDISCPIASRKSYVPFLEDFL